MKYWELINVDGKTSEPSTPPSQPQEVVKYVALENTEVTQGIKQILEYMEDINNKTVEPPVGFDKNQLNDNTQINDILNTLVDYQKQYFPNTPITKKLTELFLWNIPKKVYNAHQRVKALDEPDVLDPIFWLFCVFLDEPYDAMSTWVTQAYDSFTPEALNRIDQLNLIYEKSKEPDDEIEDMSNVEVHVDESGNNSTGINEEDIEEAEDVYPEESDDHDEEINDEEVIDDSNTEDIDVVEESTGSDDESDDTDTDESEVSDDTEGTEVTVEAEDVEEVDEEVTDTTVNTLLDSLRIDGNGNAEFTGPNAEEYENTNPDELVMDVTETKDIEVFKAD
jgi:hypothetical protein